MPARPTKSDPAAEAAASASSKPTRPPKASRIAALGLGEGAALPSFLTEDADCVAPTLSEGADDEPQDFEEFFTFEERAKVLPGRRTIYMVPLGLDSGALSPHTGPALPAVSTIGEYMSAFTGLPHKVLPAMAIVPWAAGAGKGKRGREGKKGFLAVKTKDSLVRVRAMTPETEFNTALHCHDLLDALQEQLPEDAFAIMGITAYDIHEDGVCVAGRAFGGSRIAVVSLARYAPAFEDCVPEWPACGGKKGGPHLQAARAAAEAAPVPATPQQLTALWAQRTAVTAMHELGHCLGLDHCTYYTCFMGESEGQAPHACIVCLRKLLCAVGGDAMQPTKEACLKHYKGVHAFCSAEAHKDTPVWAGLAAWAQGRATELEGAEAEAQ